MMMMMTSSVSPSPIPSSSGHNPSDDWLLSLSWNSKQGNRTKAAGTATVQQYAQQQQRKYAEYRSKYRSNQTTVCA
jgi:hypothetical protein